MIRFRRKVYEKLLESLGEKVDLMKSSIMENCTELPEVNSMTDIVEVLKSHHLKSGDFMEFVTDLDNSTEFIQSQPFPYKDNIYIMGVTTQQDWDEHILNIHIYNIKKDQWTTKKNKLKYASSGTGLILGNTIYYLEKVSLNICTYNLDTGENKSTNIKYNGSNYGDIQKLHMYKENIYFTVFSSTNFITTYKIDLLTETISEYSKFKMNHTYNPIGCYQDNFIYFSEGKILYKFDIETKTYEKFFDFSPILSMKIRVGNYVIDDLNIYKNSILIISSKIIILDLVTKTYKVTKPIIKNDERGTYGCASCIYKNVLYIKREFPIYTNMEEPGFVKYYI